MRACSVSLHAHMQTCACLECVCAGLEHTCILGVHAYMMGVHSNLHDVHTCKFARAWSAFIQTDMQGSKKGRYVGAEAHRIMVGMAPQDSCVGEGAQYHGRYGSNIQLCRC